MSQPTTTSYVGTVTLPVTGMTCDHCKRAVTEEVSRLGGVGEVVVDVDAGTVSFTASEPVAHSELAAAVDEAGYALGDPQ